VDEICENAPSRGPVLLQAVQDADLQSALLDHMEEGLYIVDRQRRILYWNAAAEEISGYSAIEATARFCHDAFLMHCDTDGHDLCGCGCPLAAVMTDGKARECRLFLRHKQGHRVPVRIALARYPRRSGKDRRRHRGFRTDDAAASRRGSHPELRLRG